MPRYSYGLRNIFSIKFSFYNYHFVKIHKKYFKNFIYFNLKE